MALIPWDYWPRPWHRLPRLFEELEKWEWPEFGELARGLNVYETKDAVVVEAAVPGISSDKVEVTVDRGMVTIRGEEEVKEEEKKKRKYYCEEKVSRFDYRTALPVSCDESKAEAEFTDGVVKVTIPKSAEVKVKPVKIKVSKKK